MRYLKWTAVFSLVFMLWSISAASFAASVDDGYVLDDAFVTVDYGKSTDVALAGNIQRINDWPGPDPVPANNAVDNKVMFASFKSVGASREYERIVLNRLSSRESCHSCHASSGLDPGGFI